MATPTAITDLPIPHKNIKVSISFITLDLLLHTLLYTAIPIDPYFLPTPAWAFPPPPLPMLAEESL